MTEDDQHRGTEGTEAPRELIFGDLTDKVLAAAIEVHRALGPGLLESAYEECLCHELTLRTLSSSGR